MFEELKRIEFNNEILSKLAQIDTKLAEMNKLLKDLQKSVRNENTKAK